MQELRDTTNWHIASFRSILSGSAIGKVVEHIMVDGTGKIFTNKLVRKTFKIFFKR